MVRSFVISVTVVRRIVNSVVAVDRVVTVCEMVLSGVVSCLAVAFVVVGETRVLLMHASEPMIRCYVTHRLRGLPIARVVVFSRVVVRTLRVFVAPITVEATSIDSAMHRC